MIKVDKAIAECKRLEEMREQERKQTEIEDLKEEIAGDSIKAMSKLNKLIGLVLEYHIDD